MPLLQAHSTAFSPLDFGAEDLELSGTESLINLWCLFGTSHRDQSLGSVNTGGGLLTDMDVLGAHSGQEDSEGGRSAASIRRNFSLAALSFLEV